MRKSAVQFLLFIWLFIFAGGAVAGGSPVWKVVKGDHYLYIGGTVHVLSPSDYPLPDVFEEAYNDSSIIVFETDTEKFQSPEFQQIILKELVYTDGRSLKTILNKETYFNLKQYFIDRQLPADNIMVYKPGMLMSFMAMVELQRLGLTGTGVDEFFSLKAKNDQKLVGQLETVQDQLSFISNMGIGNENKFVAYLLADMKQMQKLMASLKTAWRSGDHMTLEKEQLIPLKKDFPDIYNDMMVKRNLKWIPEIETMLTTKEVELILVGMLHLAGEDGLVEILKSKHYYLEML